MCARIVFAILLLLLIPTGIGGQEQSILQRLQFLEERNRELEEQNQHLREENLELKRQILERIETQILSERLDALQRKVDQLEALQRKVDQLEALQRKVDQLEALQRKVDQITIDPEGNVGIGNADPSGKLDVNGHLVAVPIVGEWTVSQRKSITGSEVAQWIPVVLDAEVYNTSPPYFTKNTDNLGVTVHIAGYYEIVAHALLLQHIGSSGHLELLRNGVRVDLDHGGSGTVSTWNDRHIHYVGCLNATDVISLRIYHQVATECGYYESPYTKLLIRRLP